MKISPILVEMTVSFIKYMGNQSCYPEEILQRGQPEQVRDVIEILEDFPEAQRNSMFRGSTTRYSDLSVIHEDYNRYIFVLKIDGQNEVRVVMPVINDLPHRALTQNYKLTIGKDMIIDPFDQRLEACLLPVKNEATQKEYSMKVIPFRGYNSIAFKRVLEEVWIYQKLKKSRKFGENPDQVFLWLEDSYVYGINHDQQAVIMLYQRIQGSLTLGAQYRWKANQPWKTAQRLQIYRDVLKACLGLQQISIIHRDIRGSNVYYSQKRKKYLLGISCAREIDYRKEDDLLTVYGIETQNEGKVRELLNDRQNMGIYKMRSAIYSQLRVLNRLLTTRRITDQIGQSEYQESIFRNIENMLLDFESLPDILKTAQNGYRIADKSFEFQQQATIARKLYHLLPERLKKMSEQFIFSVYYSLGYQKQFSDMAHMMIEKNNINGKPFANAKILKQLGSFYDKHGTGGSEYLLNACVLYCKEAESSLERLLYEEAIMYLEQGQEIYINLSGVGEFSITMIQLKRLRAELRARTLWQVGEKRYDDQKIEILELMSKTLELAAEQNLPIEKQMKIFLTWGVVHRQCGDRVAAEERFRNGLAVCQNAGSFESAHGAALIKSHFLYQFSAMKLDILQDQHDPLLPLEKQVYSPEDLPKLVQNWLQQSLQIRQKQSIRLYQPIQCLMQLGKLYLLLSEYLQAKVQLKRALIRLNDLANELTVKVDIIAEVHYDLGSVNYKLQVYQESVDHYREAITILQDKGGDPYWINVIAGNLGLAYMRAGLVERGKALLERSKEAIRAQNGAHHYDFLFLTSQEQLIAHSIEG